MKTLLFAGLTVLTVAACGGDASSSGEDGGGGTGGTGLAGGGGSGAGGSGGDSTGSSCAQDQPCIQGVCIYEQGSCEASSVGICMGGFSCDGPPTGPLCQCDGTVLEGTHALCDKWGQGEPYDDPGPCATGTFTCGPGLSCTRHVEVCVVTYPGMPGPEEYACVPVDDIAGTCAHGIADCSCLDLAAIYCDGGAACDCTSDADGQESVIVSLP